MKRFASVTVLLGLLLTGCNSSDDSGSSTSAGGKTSLFTVYGNKAYMNGEINSDIVAQLNTMTAANPQVDTIVMVQVPGSRDDEANLKASLLVRSKNLKTMLPAEAMIASGGTDFFLAGVERIVDPSARIGVHSWADGNGTEGKDLPASHPEHQSYLTYYNKIGIDPNFYWYTLNAASANDIHWMSAAEIAKYDIATREMTANEQANVFTVPSQFGQAAIDLFDRYTWVTAPNGKAIHIFAQSKVSLAQLLKARNTLEFYLTDTATVKKTIVANSMGDRGAALFIFNDEKASEDAMKGALGNSKIAEFGQDLYATEIFVEGDSRYLAAPSSARDATFEEVLHLTQAQGIAPALASLQKKISDQAEVALTNKVWNPEADQLEEWRNEGDLETGNSVSHEYFAAIVEAYYGMWTGLPVGMDGYTGNSRALQTARDSNGQAIIAEFLPEYISTTMDIDPSFAAGSTFYLDYDAALIYTAKSQYLQSVRLTGTNNSHISGNSRNNFLMGNQGDNNIDGKGGVNTYKVDGLQSEFDVNPDGMGFLIQDKVNNRNGTDKLMNIQKIEFNDSELNLPSA